MEVVEEEREGGKPALDYTHIIKPGVTQLENYGKLLLNILKFIGNLWKFSFLHLQFLALFTTSLFCSIGMKLACMVAFPPDILTRAQELIPILSAKVKVREEMKRYLKECCIIAKLHHESINPQSLHIFICVSSHFYSHYRRQRLTLK